MQANPRNSNMHPDPPVHRFPSIVRHLVSFVPQPPYVSSTFRSFVPSLPDAFDSYIPSVRLLSCPRSRSWLGRCKASIPSRRPHTSSFGVRGTEDRRDRDLSFGHRMSIISIERGMLCDMLTMLASKSLQVGGLASGNELFLGIDRPRRCVLFHLPPPFEEASR